MQCFSLRTASLGANVPLSDAVAVRFAVPDLQPPPAVLSTGASGKPPATAPWGSATPAPGFAPPTFAAPLAGDPFALSPVAVLATERSASIPGSLPPAAVAAATEQPFAMSEHPAFQPQMPVPEQV